MKRRDRAWLVGASALLLLAASGCESSGTSTGVEVEDPGPAPDGTVILDAVGGEEEVAPGQEPADPGPDAEPTPGGGPGSGPGGGAGPQACVDDADCAEPGMCLEDTVLGCTCMESPKNPGMFRCVPLCESDSDCPESAPKELKCGPQGLCVGVGGQGGGGQGGGGQGGGDGGDPGGGPGAGPPPCATDADCEVLGACPPKATDGCVCVEGADGDLGCAAVCAVDADCPEGTWCASGVCVADAGGGGGSGGTDPEPPCGSGPLSSCTTDSDCGEEGACPQGSAKGCDCLEKPNGDSVCVPNCSEDADCPEGIAGEGKILFCNPNGHCQATSAAPL